MGHQVDTKIISAAAKVREIPELNSIADLMCHSLTRWLRRPESRPLAKLVWNTAAESFVGRQLFPPFRRTRFEHLTFRWRHLKTVQKDRFVQDAVLFQESFFFRLQPCFVRLGMHCGATKTSCQSEVTAMPWHALPCRMPNPSAHNESLTIFLWLQPFTQVNRFEFNKC